MFMNNIAALPRILKSAQTRSEQGHADIQVACPNDDLIEALNLRGFKVIEDSEDKTLFSIP